MSFAPGLQHAWGHVVAICCRTARASKEVFVPALVNWVPLLAVGTYTHDARRNEGIRLCVVPSAASAIRSLGFRAQTARVSVPDASTPCDSSSTASIERPS